MKDQYQSKTICSLCGEEGVSTIETAAAEWLGATICHEDPTVCAENLKLKLNAEQRKNTT